MSNLGCKHHLIIFIELILAIFISSCSSDLHDSKQNIRSKDPKEFGSLEMLKSPSGMVLPIPNDSWSVPTVSKLNNKYSQIDLKPPIHPVTLSYKAHMHISGSTGMLVIDDYVVSIWLKIVDIIQKSHFSIIARQDKKQSLLTDWIQLNHAVGEKYFGRYKISTKLYGNQNIVEVTLLNLRNKEYLIYSPSEMQRYISQMLQYISSRLVLDPELEKILKNVDQVEDVEVRSGIDQTGFHCLILNTPFNCAWRWLPKTLKKLGMEIKNDNYAQGHITIKCNFLKNNSAHKFSGQIIHLKNGTYTIQVGDLGACSSLQFFNSDGYPLSLRQNESLVSLFNCKRYL
ncbi:outer membrane protein assembly factor BamC [Candidatus Erwinia haradaeae]|uniref:Outer membrane protein assembly factor BamC n=1 Tax=Candidatus Erwinia haradaeae TaxID=1922217 RepID=A0A451D1M1_9GAMM|nr:outer membrane protein assembly factor BamC [Candidatus Erwinia haradaeae]VFP79503.1 Outer membrane protein assembly factor BamC [Candidatus Erwinia haradaeae]